MINNISEEELRQFPVENVSWNDAQDFLTELNKRDNDPDWRYRLPTEIEWEYACRGGPMSDRLDSAFYFYLEKPTDQLRTELANFYARPEEVSTPPPGAKKSDPELANLAHYKRACKVGSFKPNRLGLYDMHGNVGEWCDGAMFNNVTHRGGAGPPPLSTAGRGMRPGARGR